MKRFIILILVFLTACSGSNPASFFNVTPVPLNLNMSSTSEQIQRALWESASRWTNLQMNGVITWYGVDGVVLQTSQERVWLDPINSRYRVELQNDIENVMKLSDGFTISNINMNTNQVESFAYPDFAKVGQYIPPIVEGEAYPNPIWGQIGTPLSELAFASDFSQNSGILTPITIETIAGRDTLVVEWRFSESSELSWKMWIDTQKGIILKLQEFNKEGGNIVQGERIVSSITFDQTFDENLFVTPTNFQTAVNPTQIGSVPVVTEASSISEEELGELYFFLQPRAAGQSIELVKVSGACVFDSSKCPPLEKIQVPFQFNFTINALSWSSDGRYAAFAYSDQPSGSPTKLWLFDAEGKTWISIAQFPFIDPPFWSPDGSWIAFRTQDGLGGEDVYVIRPDGSELKSISASLPAEGRPYVMDGWYTENVIIRSALLGSSGNIYLVRAENGQVRPMFETILTKAQFVASPDAGFLAYDEFDQSTNVHTLKVMEPDGANATTITQFIGGSMYPVIWSPDSSLLAFNYYSFANVPTAEVYVIRRTGENLSLVYKGTTIGRLIFSPNGKYLLVEETTSISGGHLFLINLATLEQKILQAPGLSTDYDWYAPSWRP